LDRHRVNGGDTMKVCCEAQNVRRRGAACCALKGPGKRGRYAMTNPKGCEIATLPLVARNDKTVIP